jgi:hypothetical protein
MKMVFGLLVVIVSLYLCVELIPPYYSNYEFQDALQNEALTSTNSAKTEDAIRDTVFKKAQDLQIPVVKESIQVHRNGTQGSGSVSIEVPYSVHLDMVLYPLDLHFDAAAVNKGVM